MKKGKPLIKEILEWTITILGAVFIAICIRSYACAQTEVRQCSMQDTLYEGQRVIEYKIGYYFSNPKREDIVIINKKSKNGIVDKFLSNTKDLIDRFTFSKENIDDKRLIKRVIGLPRETIDIREGKVFINGKVIKEDYIKSGCVTDPNETTFPLKIPENMYFVMGDNRDNSMDSRSKEVGLININQIEGEAIFRLWPLNKIGSF